jgi:hypothetical protein
MSDAEKPQAFESFTLESLTLRAPDPTALRSTPVFIARSLKKSPGDAGLYSKSVIAME